LSTVRHINFRNAEYDVSNVLQRKYIYGPAVDEPIGLIEAAGSYAGTYYYHFDALGSVTALTNSSGNTVEVYDYDVYGRVGATDASHPNRFMFTGREYDKETGLYYYRARYYNPQIGRFLQTDPIGYKDGMNWYRYCGNNPVQNTDPSGLFRYIWGKDVTDPEKKAIEASFKRVGQRCGELIKWIDDTTHAFAVEMDMGKGDPLIDELQKLRYTLRAVKMGIDSNTVGLKVGFKDTGGDYGMYQTTLLSRFPGIYLDSGKRIPSDQVTMDQTIMHECGHWAGLPLFDRVLPNDSWDNAYRFDELMTNLPNETKPWNLNYYLSVAMALNRKYPGPIAMEPPPPSNDPSDVPSWIVDPDQEEK
jgi:RHS repeat-associated protein